MIQNLRREKRKPGVQERRAEKRKREQEGMTASGGSQGEVEMGRVDWKGVLQGGPIGSKGVGVFVAVVGWKKGATKL